MPEARGKVREPDFGPLATGCRALGRREALSLGAVSGKYSREIPKFLYEGNKSPVILIFHIFRLRKISAVTDAILFPFLVLTCPWRSPMPSFARSLSAGH